MTYRSIQDEYRAIFNKTIKNCWIADVKRELGFQMKDAPNRINPDIIKNRCLDQEVRERIKTIIRKQKS